MIFFTAGYSGHTLETFCETLKQQGITAIADVRSSPYSKRYPSFSRATLCEGLRQRGIAYSFLGEQLGARRSEQCCYEGDKARYDLIAKTEAFQSGLQRLRAGAEKYQICLMCAEADPIECHRAILVGRHLRDESTQVHHLVKQGVIIETQEQFEKRLCDETYGVLFGDVELAYDAVSDLICYRRK